MGTGTGTVIERTVPPSHEDFPTHTPTIKKRNVSLSTLPHNLQLNLLFSSFCSSLSLSVSLSMSCCLVLSLSLVSANHVWLIDLIQSEIFH